MEATRRGESQVSNRQTCRLFDFGNRPSALSVVRPPVSLIFHGPRDRPCERSSTAALWLTLGHRDHARSVGCSRVAARRVKQVDRILGHYAFTDRPRAIFVGYEEAFNTIVLRQRLLGFDPGDRASGSPPQESQERRGPARHNCRPLVNRDTIVGSIRPVAAPNARIARFPERSVRSRRTLLAW
jgi:hypothetical protein